MDKLFTVYNKLVKEGGIDMKDFQVGLNLYLQCCYGYVIVAKIVEHGLSRSEFEAKDICLEMLKINLLSPVDGKNVEDVVFNPKWLYRFNTDQAKLEMEKKYVEPRDVTGKLIQVDREVTESAKKGMTIFHTNEETSKDNNVNNNSQNDGSFTSVLSTQSEKYYSGISHSSSRLVVPWTDQQEHDLVVAVSLYGENWMLVSHYVQDRTEDECENRWVEKLMEAKISSPGRRHPRFFIRKRFHTRKDSSGGSQGNDPRQALTADYLKRQQDNAFFSNPSKAMDASMLLPSSGSFARRSTATTQEMVAGAVMNRRRANSLDGSTTTGGKKNTLFHFSQSLRLLNHHDYTNSGKTTSTATNSIKDNLLQLVDDDSGAQRKVVEGNTNDVTEEKGNNLLLLVMKLENAPESSRGLRESHYLVKIYCNNSHIKSRPVVKRPRYGISWQEVLSLNNVTMDTLLEIRLLVKHRLVSDEELGRTQITCGQLAQRPYRQLVLSDTYSRVVMDNENENVTLLTLGVDKSTIPQSWPMPIANPNQSKKFDKHLLIITRGTRGDVQPFLALARGLANMYNWKITICTELRYREYVKKNALNLERGCIEFRVSGGDTQKRVDSKISKWAINLQSSAMQNLMLAFSEREFFDSEAAMFYWAKTLEPDYLMFGFTLASIAMIISEALQLPLIGFILQPTTIPSSQYPPVIPLDENAYKKISEMDGKRDRKHLEFSSLKVIVENNPITGQLNHMRQRRGLQPIKRYSGKGFLHLFQSNTWTDLQAKNIPLIVPINEIAFGGKPPDWGESTILTNYIFLRGKTVPDLDPSHVKFIENAKSQGQKLIVLAFSSMPVEKLDILRIAIKMIKNCQRKVCVIALIGDHTDDPGHDKDVEETAELLISQGRLLVDRGAPFGKLFNLMDVIVAHGGLGTTGEAIMSQVPVIITGVLLFDQRFWGSRCHDMKMGPFPVHISKFLKSCVSLIDKALDNPQYGWKTNAEKAGKTILESMADDPTGVKINAKVVHDQLEHAPYFTYIRQSKSTSLIPSRPKMLFRNYLSGGGGNSSSSSPTENGHNNNDNASSPSSTGGAANTTRNNTNDDSMAKSEEGEVDSSKI